jgi:DNA-binding LytR/AlgR family response regulator
MIITEQRKFVYSESLDALMKHLNSAHFYRANRQTIVHHDLIKSIKALEHGKIEASLKPANGQAQTVIISRTKASEFRKWLRSQSV